MTTERDNEVHEPFYLLTILPLLSARTPPVPVLLFRRQPDHDPNLPPQLIQVQQHPLDPGPQGYSRC